MAVYAIASTSRTSARLISAQRQSTVDVSAAVGAAVTSAVQGAVQSLVAPPLDPRADVNRESILPNMPTYEFPDKFEADELYDPTDAYIPDGRHQVLVGTDTGIEGFTFQAAD